MLHKTLLSFAILFLPVMVHAQIYTHTSASSNSGGNVVGPGGRVTTGDSSASVQVTTNTSSSNTSTIEIKTTTNSAVHEETVTTRGPTNVSVEATPATTTIQVEEGTPPVTIKRQVITPPAAAREVPVSAIAVVGTVAMAESVAAPEESRLGLGTWIVLAVHNLFSGIFGWLK